MNRGVQGRIALVEGPSDDTLAGPAQGEILTAGADFKQSLALVAEETPEGITKAEEAWTEGAAQTKVHIVPQSVYDYILGTPAGFIHPGSTWLEVATTRRIIGSGPVDTGPLAGLAPKPKVQASSQQPLWKDRRTS